jgi:hypothetical protein
MGNIDMGTVYGLNEINLLSEREFFVDASPREVPRIVDVFVQTI